MAEISAPKRKKPAKNKEVEPTSDPQLETTPKQISFFQRVQNIPIDDWGTRCRIRVYRLEPLVDTVRSTGRKYITVYDDAPPTEERIKQDHGSGRYRLYLGMKTAGSTSEKEIDKVEIDILDPKFPPVLDLGDWLDDPKNKKWKWAKEILEERAMQKAASSAKPEAPPASPNVLDTFKTFTTIQDSIIQRITPAESAAKAADPIDTALRLVTVMQGGGQATLMEMFRDEMRGLRESNKQLQEELRAAVKKEPAPPPPDPLEFLEKGADRLAKLKTLFGGNGAESDDGLIPKAARSKMGAGAEIAVRLIEKAVESPVLAQIASVLMMRTTAPANPPPQQNGFHAAPGAPNGTTQPAAVVAPQNPQQVQMLNDFLQSITLPMLNYFGDEMTGTEFAEWVYNGFGEKWQHPIYKLDVPWLYALKQLGTPRLLIYFQSVPYWATLQPHELRFTQFLDELTAYVPAADETEPAVKPADEEPEVIELAEEPAGALI